MALIETSQLIMIEDIGIQLARAVYIKLGMMFSNAFVQ